MRIAAFALPLLFRWTSPKQVDVSDVDKTLLFRELYKHALSSKQMSLIDKWRKRISVRMAFRYVGVDVKEVNGIAMDVCVPAGDSDAMLDTEKYDDMYGAGAAEKAIGRARSKALRQRKRAMQHSSECCSQWKCDRRCCLLVGLGAGIGVVACGVASGLCCSFVDADTAVDDFSNLADGNNDVSSRFAPEASDSGKLVIADASDNRLSNHQSPDLPKPAHDYSSPKDAYFRVEVVGADTNNIVRTNVPVTTFDVDNNELPNELLPGFAV